MVQIALLTRMISVASAGKNRYVGLENHDTTNENEQLVMDDHNPGKKRKATKKKHRIVLNIRQKRRQRTKEIQTKEIASYAI